ncbi:MAG: hypothetical protein JOY81_01580, partial [Alphaproteobacteria bacterium]|nr:hypothetical protein [Alphaproteobacteria bacterium]
MTALPDIPAAVNCSYPLRHGNRVHPLIGTEEIFSRLGEAVDRAEKSIWVTVAFFGRDFAFPGGRGLAFDVFNRAAQRGLDVRLLVWRPNPEARPHPTMLKGDAADREMLAARGFRPKIRWDR